MTKEATLAMSSSERRPPKEGMAPFPLVTWVRTEASERPPARYWSRASFSRVFSGMITFCPPAWQAAQLASKILSPAVTSPAKAGAVQTVKATAPAQAACSHNQIARMEEVRFCSNRCVLNNNDITPMHFNS